MKPDDFENELQRQPVRAIPRQWRGEILRAAQAAGAAETAGDHWLLVAAGLKLWRELIQPSRFAWAGFAAAWVLILAVNLTELDRSRARGPLPAAPSPELREALAQQHRLLVELLPPAPRDVTAPPKRNSQPRSDRQPETLCA